MTLSEFSFTVRRAAPVVILGFTLFIVFFVLMRMLFTALRPSAPQTVYTPAFGKIDPITFSQKIDYPPNPLFTIDNIECRPITASSSADIYFVPQPTSRFGYAQALSFMAKAVGFSPETNYALTGTEAVYENGSQRLKVDISNFNFTFDLNFEQQPEIFDNTIIPD
ncbi:hypothetical protein A3G65_03785 [Candidatus Roizmanbacteria bacterium RIFCSPLOWO2_12_FULL_37_7b]|nr:MAG: hypothetical protein A3G65_03785 [Candidatus Roizmanbacteria bacterium RIFCSPLOWO2_12_FULL_37_7b]